MTAVRTAFCELIVANEDPLSTAARAVLLQCPLEERAETLLVPQLFTELMFS
jgi:hypothetical protein